MCRNRSAPTMSVAALVVVLLAPFVAGQEARSAEPTFFVISACNPCERSQEDPRPGHAGFTRFLLEALEGKVADGPALLIVIDRCKPVEKVRNDPQSGHGDFTRSLLDALLGKAADGPDRLIIIDACQPGGRHDRDAQAG